MQRSESLKEFAAAMAKVQASVRPAIKDAQNPHLKNRYADLASVWDACREALTANGFAVLQAPSAVGKSVSIETLLIHASGEWVSETLTLEARDASPQSIGSAVTYGRRYGLSAMVGVCPEDDDGEAAMHRAAPQERPRAQPAPPPTRPPAKRDDRPFSTLVQDELERRHKEFRGDHPDAKDVLNVFEALRHMLKASVLERRLGDPGTVKDSQVRQLLGELYRKPEHYGPMRRELSAYLSAKFKEAHERAVLEEQGDVDIDEVKAEAAAGPAGREPGQEG